MELQERETAAYETEYRNTAARPMREVPPYKEAEQFLDLVRMHFSLDACHTQRPKVIVLGSAFPEELIYAFGITPYWVLGGSLQTGAWAGELAPRDADPVSRSILGLLLGLKEQPQDALILLPMVSDSTRKLAYLLRREGLKVHTLDIPPVKDEPATLQYERQLELCVEALSAHTGQHLNRRALQNAAVSVAQARQEMVRLIRLDREKPCLLPASWRMLALNSYYAADDIRHWTRMLAQLNNRLIISQKYRRHPYQGNVLLTGSPVYFPNYKLPVLLEDVRLHIAAHIDYTTQKIKTALPAEEAAQVTLPSLARRFYLDDCSGSYAKNEG